MKQQIGNKNSPQNFKHAARNSEDKICNEWSFAEIFFSSSSLISPDSWTNLNPQAFTWISEFKIHFCFAKEFRNKLRLRHKFLKLRRTWKRCEIRSYFWLENRNQTGNSDNSRGNNKKDVDYRREGRRFERNSTMKSAEKIRNVTKISRICIFGRRWARSR